MHRLPVHSTAHAAALAAVLGVALEPKSYLDTDTDGERSTWFVTSRVQEAAELLERERQGKLEAAAPFRAALVSISNVYRLLRWISGQGRAPSPSMNGAFLQLTDGAPVAPAAVPSGEVRIDLRSPAEMAARENAALAATFRQGAPFPVFPHHVAAAAISCGFLPLGLTGSAEAPGLRLTAASLTEPALTFAGLLLELERRLLPPLSVEHPWHYAFEGIRHYAGLMYAQGLSAANPVHIYRAESGNGRSALISQALLEEGHPLGLGDKLDAHLAGTL